MTGRSRIDTAQLDGVRLSPDGSRLILLLRDTAGQKVSVVLADELPQQCADSSAASGGTGYRALG